MNDTKRKRNTDGLVRHSQESNDFTKKCLKDALVILCKEKAFKEISVTELCKKAGVSRMAFYRNYDVVNDIFKDLAADLNLIVAEKYGSPFRVTTDKEWYRNVFTLVQEHSEPMALMFREDFQYEWMKTVNGFTIHDPSFSAEKKYQRLMWSGGFENMVAQWLNGGCKESPEEMAEYCMKYLPHLER